MSENSLVKVLSLKSSKFSDFVHGLNLIELEIKNTTDTARFSSYLDIHFEIDSKGQLRTKVHDKSSTCILSIYPLTLFIRYFRACNSLIEGC
jgi:hypothetical protein